MYLDPAFAGMLLQILLALVVVGGVTIFTMRRKITEMFSKKNDKIQSKISMQNEEDTDEVINTLN